MILIIYARNRKKNVIIEVFSQWKLRNPKDFYEKSTLVRVFFCLFVFGQKSFQFRPTEICSSVFVKLSIYFDKRTQS